MQTLAVLTFRPLQALKSVRQYHQEREIELSSGAFKVDFGPLCALQQMSRKPPAAHHIHHPSTTDSIVLSLSESDVCLLSCIAKSCHFPGFLWGCNHFCVFTVQKSGLSSLILTADKVKADTSLQRLAELQSAAPLCSKYAPSPAFWDTEASADILHHVGILSPCSVSAGSRGTECNDWRASFEVSRSLLRGFARMSMES